MSLENNRHSLYKSDIIIALIIILLPFAFYLYLVFPPKETISVFNTTFYFSQGWDMEYVIWILFSKLFILFTFSLWFLTCQHWWRYTILGVVYIAIRQIYGLVVDTIDVSGNSFSEWVSVLIFIPFLFVLIYLSKLLRYYVSDRSVNKDLSNEMENMINNIKHYNKTAYNIHLKEFEELKRVRYRKSKKKHLIYLLELKSKLKKYNFENNQ